HLAAAIIRYQTGDGPLNTSLQNLADLLDTDPDTAPGSFDEVCALVEQTDGIHLTRLLDQLPPPRPDPHTAMTDVLRLASQTATTAQVDQAIALWDPVLSALRASLTHPDQAVRTTAAQALDQVLTAAAQDTRWQALVPVLRRIHTGETDPATLLPGLDHIGTQTAQRALDMLAGTLTVDPDAWHTLPPPDQHGTAPPRR